MLYNLKNFACIFLFTSNCNRPIMFVYFITPSLYAKNKATTQLFIWVDVYGLNFALRRIKASILNDTLSFASIDRYIDYLTKIWL